MKKADFKQFMLEKGERVCLYVACGLAGLLLVFFLFKPGSGLFSGSASANAEALKKKAEDKERERRAATMKETDKPEPLTQAFESFRVKVVKADDYPSRSMFEVPPKKDTKRQQPDIFRPDQFQIMATNAQVPYLEYQYGSDGLPEKVYVIKAPGDAGAGNTGGTFFGALGMEGMMGGMPPGGYAPSTQNLGGTAKQGGSGYSGGMGAIGSPGGMYGGFVPPSSGVSGQPSAEVKTKAELVKIEEAEQNRWPLATRVLPLRMAVVSASFPYKQQVEEFRQKLRLPTHGAVLSEQLVDEVTVSGRKTWKYRPSFQFRGFEVERAEVIPGEDLRWVLIDLEGPSSPYRQIIVHTNKNFEPEDPKHRPLEAVSRGLVMGLPKQFRPGLYPKLSDKLDNIQRTLDKLKDADNKKIIVSKPKNDEFDPFDPLATTTAAQFADPSKGPYFGGEAMPPPAAGGMGEGFDPYGVVQGNADARAITETPIDHCLMRFVDVTVQPGKSYRYRLRIKMANPNYSPQPAKRKDTYVHYARVKELYSPWVEVPQTVRLPAEEIVYAVDQKNLEPRLPRVLPEPSQNQVVVQFQKWVDYYRPNPDKDEKRAVGEWLVYPRLLVERGEYVRTTYDGRANDPMTEVPFKSIHSFNFELDYRKIGNRTFTLMPVMFGGDEPGRQSAVLVDFDRGKSRHERTTLNPKGKPETKVVEDAVSTEVLMVRPDGSVIARNSAVDNSLDERDTRYKAYLKRIDDIKKAKTGGTGGTTGQPGMP